MEVFYSVSSAVSFPTSFTAHCFLFLTNSLMSVAHTIKPGLVFLPLVPNPPTDECFHCKQSIYKNGPGCSLHPGLFVCIATVSVFCGPDVKAVM